MSMIPIIQYTGGLAIFGLTYWLLDNILLPFIQIGTTGTVTDTLHMLWTASLIIYLIGGGYWIIRQYNEQQYNGGLYP